MDCLDLLQFHWADYQNQDYLEALYHLSELQKVGKIKHLALTNFDTEHLKIITEAGIKVISNQVQLSLIDRRPLLRMAKYCQEKDIKLLAYGTLAGGLLTHKYLINHDGLGTLTRFALHFRTTKIRYSLFF